MTGSKHVRLSVMRFCKPVMLWTAIVLGACFEVTIPPEEHLNPPLEGLPSDVAPDQTTRPPVGNEGDIQGPGVQSVDQGSDAFPVRDDTPPKPCDSLCDCEPGNDCINAICVPSPPVQCCTHPLCEAGRPCWLSNGEQGTCNQ